jgi:hypothetical protein
MAKLSIGRPPDVQPDERQEQCGFWRSRVGLATVGFLLIGASLLLFEHRLHVLGYLPFLILLLCPLLHVFMHRGHGHGAQRRPDQQADPRNISEGT